MADDKEDKKPKRLLPGHSKWLKKEAAPGDEKPEEPKEKRKFVPKHERDPRIKQVIKNMLSGMTLREAGLAAGYKENYMQGPIYRYGQADYIKTQVARRMTDARSKAAIHTDAIVGSLVEIMQGSPADILPEHEILRRAKENQVDHLIKKIVITPVKIGTRIRKLKDGSTTDSPVVREKVELEMYSRLDAIQQLRDNFGMKQEPRANSFEETKRQEVEREIQGIMIAESCDEPTAAQILLDNIGDAPHLVQVIQKYIKKHKKDPKEPVPTGAIN